MMLMMFISVADYLSKPNRDQLFRMLPPRDRLAWLLCTTADVGEA